jgi:3-deoxy-D-manno-octulosonic-acid transferase
MSGRAAWAEWVARAAYSVLLRMATPVYLARLWWRGRREPGYRRHLGQRLGFAGGVLVRGRIWIHAVSLGETLAAAPLLAALRAQRPGLAVLLTHGTATGWQAGQALLREGDAQAWAPYDTPGAVRRFLQAHRPALGVVMETEVWPNLLHGAARAGVPMALANARLSARSQSRGQHLRWLLHPALARFAQVLAQTSGDAQRLSASGAAHVSVVGNLKFDIEPRADQLARGRQWRAELKRPVLLAASTREGEEPGLLQAYAALPNPRPLLLLVPRHPQRFDAVAEMVNATGLRAVRRSAWQDAPGPRAADADIWLGDSLGEMPLYYGLADVALLGGSFAPLGGHNLIEAAACGCPVVMGLHTFNFAQAAEQALAAGAAERAPDIATAVQRAAALTTDPHRASLSANALHFATQHRGASQRTAIALLALLPSGQTPQLPQNPVGSNVAARAEAPQDVPPAPIQASRRGSGSAGPPADGPLGG